MCIHRISTVGYRVVNVNGACNRSDTDGCSRTMPLGILVVSSVPRSYSTYVGDTGTVFKIIHFCGWKIGRRRTYEQYARRTWDPILYLPKFCRHPPDILKTKKRRKQKRSCEKRPLARAQVPGSSIKIREPRSAFSERARLPFRLPLAAAAQKGGA